MVSESQTQGQGWPNAIKSRKQAEQSDDEDTLMSSQVVSACTDQKQHQDSKRMEEFNRMQGLVESFWSVLRQGSPADKAMKSSESSPMLESSSLAEQADDIASLFEQLVLIKKTLIEVQKKREEAK